MKIRKFGYLALAITMVWLVMACQNATSSSSSIVGTWTLTDFNTGFGPMTSNSSNITQSISFASDGTFTTSETNSSGTTTGSGVWSQSGSNFTVVLQKTTGTSALGLTNFTLNSDGTLTYTIGGGFNTHYKRIS